MKPFEKFPQYSFSPVVCEIGRERGNVLEIQSVSFDDLRITHPQPLHGPFGKYDFEISVVKYPKPSTKFFYLAVLCLIALAIVIAAMACIYYKMPERGIPL